MGGRFRTLTNAAAGDDRDHSISLDISTITPGKRGSVGQPDDMEPGDIFGSSG